MDYQSLAHESACPFARGAITSDATALSRAVFTHLTFSGLLLRPFPDGREKHYWGVAHEIAAACRRHCDACVTRCNAADPCHHILEHVYLAAKQYDPSALPDIVGMVSTTLWPDPDPDVPRQH